MDVATLSGFRSPVLKPQDQHFPRCLIGILKARRGYDSVTACSLANHLSITLLANEHILDNQRLD